jgi:hypothetical protein
MIFGLGTIGASAAFEGETIQYNTAVQTMAGMGILTGNEKGEFNPTGNLTRAAAAKIVAYVALGKTVADKLPSTEVFKDLKANDPQYGYAAKFVAYLYTKGIVNGYGDGNYGPGDSVTVMQFAKMLLCAIGYGKNNEYIGKGWDTNVLIDASNTDIIKDFTGDTDKVITREEASLFAFNALTQDNAKIAKFDNDTKTYDNTYAGAKTLGASKYNLAEAFTGVVTKNQSVGDKYTVVTGLAASATPGATPTDKSFNIVTTKDLIGHYITVYYANDNANGYSVYSYSDIGTVKKYANTFLSDTTARDNAQKAALGVSTVEGAANWYSFASDYTCTAKVSTDAIANNDYGTYVLYNGKVVAYLADPTYVISRVTKIDTTAGAEAITLAGVNGGVAISNKSTDDKVIEYDGIAVGDYVSVTQLGTVFTLTKFTTVTGTITSYTNNADPATAAAYPKSAIVVNGTTYRMTGATDNYSGIADVSSSLNFTDTFTLYLDANNRFFAVTQDTTTGSTNLFYCTGSYVKTLYLDTGALPVTYYKGINAAGEYASYSLTQGTTAPSVGNMYRLTINGTTGAATFTNVTSLIGTGVAPVSTLTGQNANAVGANWTVTASAFDVDWAKDGATPASNYYISKDVTVIYVMETTTPGTGTAGTSKSPIVTIKKGITEDLNLDDSDYVLATKVTGTNNWTVNTIIYNGSANMQVAGSLIYVANAAVTARVAYNGATGVAETDMYSVYIDGVKTDIMSDDTLAVGFYTYEKNKYGVYTLTTATTGCASGRFTNYYNGLLSFGSITNKDASKAVVVNTTRTTGLATTVDQLTSEYDIAVAWDALGSVTYIYITGYTPAT